MRKCVCVFVYECVWNSMDSVGIVPINFFSSLLLYNCNIASGCFLFNIIVTNFYCYLKSSVWLFIGICMRNLFQLGSFLLHFFKFYIKKSICLEYKLIGLTTCVCDSFFPTSTHVINKTIIWENEKITNKTCDSIEKSWEMRRKISGNSE